MYLIPAYVLKSASESLNNKTAAFLPHSLPEYAAKGDLYRLTTNDECDTGLLENQIMKELPESKKRVFRVLKFLNQNILFGNITDGKCDNINLDKEMLLHLYGYKPLTSSYHLRVFFLHLLLHVHGTPAEQELSDGRFFMCLIDMLKDSNNVNMDHHLIQGRRLYGLFLYQGFEEKIKSVLKKMRYFRGEVKLLSSENQVWLDSMDKRYSFY